MDERTLDHILESAEESITCTAMTDPAEQVDRIEHWVIAATGYNLNNQFVNYQDRT